MRNIGVEPRINREALVLSYQLINDFSKQKLNSKKITFFVTALLAKDMSDLLKQIATDGHEIGCHYFYHDLMFKQSNLEINRNLELAKNAIFQATDIEPVVFRAPTFSIPRERRDIFSEVEKHFKLDSSYVLDLGKFTKEQYFQESPFTLEHLIEIPIVPKNFFSRKLKMKSGGTYFRFFSKKMIEEVMLYNVELGFAPLVYLHPYDYLQNREFWVSINDFIGARKLKYLIKYFRQIQWVGIGNRSVFPKLNYLLENFEHQGPMSLLLDEQ